MYRFTGREKLGSEVTPETFWSRWLDHKRNQYRVTAPTPVPTVINWDDWSEVDFMSAETVSILRAAMR